MNPSPLKVDVFPLQAQNFAAAHTRREQEGEGRVEARLIGYRPPAPETRMFTPNLRKIA